MNARTVLAAFVCLAAPLATPARGQNGSAAEDKISATESEVRALRRSLDAKEAELDRLRRENEELRRRKTPPQPAPATATVIVPEASRPLDAVSSPTPDDIIAVTDLVAYFASHPESAKAKFAGRRFLIRGRAAEFRGATLQRKFRVDFEPATATPRVRATVIYPNEWTSAFVSQDGDRVVRRTDLGNFPLLERGVELVIRARCDGVENQELRFSDGSIERRK